MNKNKRTWYSPSYRLEHKKKIPKRLIGWKGTGIGAAVNGLANRGARAWRWEMIFHKNASAYLFSIDTDRVHPGHPLTISLSVHPLLPSPSTLQRSSNSNRKKFSQRTNGKPVRYKPRRSGASGGCGTPLSWCHCATVLETPSLQTVPSSHNTMQLPCSSGEIAIGIRGSISSI